MSNQWDNIAELFRAGQGAGSRHSLDNELIAFPAILGLCALTDREAPRRILDYGCGGGGFCRILRRYGHNVLGMDTSERMIDMARAEDANPESYLRGSASELPEDLSFDVITAIMVFQFLPDLRALIEDLARHQSNGGELLFAVHNPAYVRASMAAGSTLFQDFTNGVPGQGEIVLGGMAIPIIIRTVQDYDEILRQGGSYERRGEPVYPPFTPEFLQQYPLTPASDTPKFCILRYARAAPTST